MADTDKARRLLKELDLLRDFERAVRAQGLRTREEWAAAAALDRFRTSEGL